MSLEEFKAKLAASREKWVTVQEGKEILMHRPDYILQCELQDKSPGTESYMASLLLACAKDWRGFSMADLIPGEPTELIAFDKSLLLHLMDQTDWRNKITAAFVEFWVAHKKHQEQAEKN